MEEDVRHWMVSYSYLCDGGFGFGNIWCHCPGLPNREAMDSWRDFAAETARDKNPGRVHSVVVMSWSEASAP